jgi:hypothetical protein
MNSGVLTLSNFYYIKLTAINDTSNEKATERVLQKSLQVFKMSTIRPSHGTRQHDMRVLAKL